MNHSQKNIRRYVLWIGGTTLYLLALILLTAVESGDPDASIRTLGDAFWYSLVTMSTVGYGDLYPVTAAGKALGMVFVLLSLGLLTFVISLLIKLVAGKLLPALKLWRLRKKQWFVFSSGSEDAKVLAENLRQAYPQGVFLFPGEDAQEGFVAYPGTMEALAAQKQGDCALFYMDGEYEQAVQALALGHPVYCMTEFAPDTVPEGLTLFDPFDCCGRAYWQKFGLGEKEKRIVIIGSGKFAENLLVRGLLLNVYSPWQQVEHHVFGDWDDFLRNHYRLADVIGLQEKVPNGDSLFVHEHWNADPELLAKADRIILCADDAEENRKILGMLRMYFPTKGRVHIRSYSPIAGETVFGSREDIFTAELVMHSKLTLAARTMHEIYRESTGGAAPAWEQLSEFLRQSNIAAADHLLTKIRILLQDSGICEVTPENCQAAYACYLQTREAKKEQYRWVEHARWMRLHSLYNWEYDETRNNAARRHPQIRPFEELSEAEQAKDDYAWELLEEMGKNLSN